MQISKVVLFMLAGLTSTAAALAGPGLSYTFNSANITTSGTNWSGASSVNLNTPTYLNGALSSGPWVSARVTATRASGGSVTQSAFALGTVNPTGTSLTPTFTGGSAYYSASGQAVATPTANNALWVNMPLSTTFNGSGNLNLGMRNSGGSTPFTNISVTLFQAATADISSSLTSSSPLFTRPGSYSGSGSPTAGSTLQSYASYDFTVSTTGSYYVSMINNSSTGMYGLLYANGFNAAAPTTNLVRSTNTLFGTSTRPSVGGVLTTGFTASGADFQTAGVPGITLTAGVTYTYVVSGASFSSTTPTTGNYRVYFEGPGSVTIPTPGAAALLGLGGLMASRRRRA